MKKVVIAGGTGFIGNYIAKRFKEDGYHVLIVSRAPGHVSWNPLELEKAIDNSELVINLSGKSVNCKHNPENRKVLLNSRIEPTIWIGNAVQACVNPPKVWINASATGIYKPSEVHPSAENETDLGTHFLAQLVHEWEKTFFGFQLPNTRQIALRTSVVLGKNGGALKPLVSLSKFGLGGKQASGKQKISWIHIEDYYRILLFLVEYPTLSGVINATSPYPISNKSFMHAIRQTLHVPIGIPAPKFAIQLGAKLIDTEPSLLLDSSYIVPQRLLGAGFHFTYSKLKKALSNLLEQKN